MSSSRTFTEARIWLQNLFSFTDHLLLMNILLSVAMTLARSTIQYCEAMSSLIEILAKRVIYVNAYMGFV